MHRALVEALHSIPPEQLIADSTTAAATAAGQQWLSMPRKYTRKSVRFTVPINTYDLESLTPFQYVSQHVWLSDYRKELCRCVFNKHQPQPPSAEQLLEAGAAAVPADQAPVDPYAERTLDCMSVLDTALADALGFYATPERVAELRVMLCLTPEIKEINFRSWCGVVAFGERFLNGLSREEDPCDEVSGWFGGVTVHCAMI